MSKDWSFNIEHIYDGAKFVCLWNGEAPERYTTGKEYTATCHPEFDNYYVIVDNDGQRGLNILAENWLVCTYDNGGTWVEFYPTELLSDEDLFTVLLGGVESVFGKRTTFYRGW